MRGGTVIPTPRPGKSFVEEERIPSSYLFTPPMAMGNGDSEEECETFFDRFQAR